MIIIIIIITIIIILLIEKSFDYKIIDNNYIEFIEDILDNYKYLETNETSFSFIGKFYTQDYYFFYIIDNSWNIIYPNKYYNFKKPVEIKCIPLNRISKYYFN